MIYFIQNTKTKAIKIGYTKDNPKGRLKSLQTGSADKLELVFTMEGEKSLEAKLHEVFSDNRLNGEWFRLNMDLIYYLTSKGLFGHLTVNPELTNHFMTDLSSIAMIADFLGVYKEVEPMTTHMSNTLHDLFYDD